MTRKVALALLAFAALVAVLGVVRLRTVPEASAWTRMRRSDLVVSVDVTGVLRAVESVELGPPLLVRMSEFTITKLAPEGSTVRKGDPVVVFDQRVRAKMVADRKTELEALHKNLEKKLAEYARKRRDDELALAKAEAGLRRARMQLEVPAELVGSSELAKARIEHRLAKEEVSFLARRIRARAAVEAADVGSDRLNIRKLEGRIKEGQEILDSLVVRAPRDGTVIYRASEQGEKKRVGDTVWRQDRIVELPDLTRMRADGEVDEADAGRIEIGQTARLRLDAHPDQEFAGTVESIGSAVERPSAGSPVAVVRVQLVIDRTDPVRMRPGMRFRGQIELARIAQALVIPSDAIRPSPAGPVAFRRKLGGVEPVSLVLGRRNGGIFEVLGGLEEGETVALLHGARTGH